MIDRHKKFKDVLPYTYLIKHKPTGFLYHGIRYSNISNNRTPYEDLGKYYFGSSVSFKSIFNLKKFKQSPEDYEYKLCWTFNSVEDALIYEERVNKRIIQRTESISKGIIKGQLFANACYGKAIIQTDEVKRKQKEKHNSPCDCGCNLTKAQCNSLRSANTRTNDICSCKRIPECDGSLTTYACSGLRCRDNNVYELIHSKTEKKVKGTQVELSNLIGCQTSHINAVIKGHSQSVFGYTKLTYQGSVRILNEIKTIKHKELGVLKGTIKQLAILVDAGESHIAMLFNSSSKKVKTVKGWFNPEFNTDGLGGYGSGALKNRWWQNIKKQTHLSLSVWRDIEKINTLWEQHNKPGYFKFTQIMNEQDHLITRSRVEKIVKLFKDTEQYNEMLQQHKKTDFDHLIKNSLIK